MERTKRKIEELANSLTEKNKPELIKLEHQKEMNVNPYKHLILTIILIMMTIFIVMMIDVNL